MAREKLFQIGVKALITDSKDRVLLLNTGDYVLKGMKPHWDIPGGRIQEGSSVLETLKREVEEEIGVERILESDFFTAVISNFGGKVDGHDIGLALMIYRIKIPVNSQIKLSHEHSDYKWVTPAEAAEKLAYKYPPEFTQKLL